MFIDMEEIKFSNGSNIKIIKANDMKRSKRGENITIYPITKEFMYKNHCCKCKNFLGKDHDFTSDKCQICMSWISSSENIILNEEHMKNIKVKNIHIENSYSIWKPRSMRTMIVYQALKTYEEPNPEKLLNRSYESMYLEWILHNIGYYCTLPFIKNEKIKIINERFRHVDLEEHT